MSQIVLVHGSWMGGWAWDRVKPLLLGAGHHVEAIDLPGYGQSDSRPVSEITLQSYADAALQAIDAADEPVLLVGHSMGGIVVSTAAEQRPEGVRRAVYLAAYMLPAGESVFSFSQSNPEFSSSRVVGFLEVDESAGTSRIREDGIGPVFVNDGSEDDVTFARTHAHVDFLAPSATPLVITGERWGSVPRTYIETLRDRAVPLAAQKKMNQLLPGAQIESLDTGHSPFITAPEELARLLLAQT